MATDPPTRTYRAGSSVQDLCRACMQVRLHTVMAANPDGTIHLTKIDEETLRSIADITGGQYFRATDAEALKKIYGQILELERTKFQVKQFEKAHEYYRWAAIPALLLLGLELLLAQTRLRVLP